MKTIQKILAPDLPAPVGTALGTAFGTDIILAATPADGMVYDLVLLCTDRNAVDVPPGVPVLRQFFKTPQRLGAIMRQIRQILADPVLYLDDIIIADCTFQPQEKMLLTPQAAVSLTDKEVEILAYLIRRRGATVSRDDLLKDVWRYQAGVDTHTLETHIYRLRQKTSGIPALADALSTDEDGGYRFVMPSGTPSAVP
ncbi:MAG TPA: helix-turn-helix domain-containing protein [Alphaproteobacteria bacterium]|nr:helix-turn-helix domain-containing protein [Alphaproteobacteria bacterium]